MRVKSKFLVIVFFILSMFCLGLSFGGVICYKTSSVYATNGGAIYLKNGATYTMKGGSIKNKTATNGGAVYVSDETTFNMGGGEISENLADYGSGVYIENGGTFNMSGGTMADDVYTAGSMVYTGGTVSGDITLAGSENLTIGAVPAEPLNINILTTAVGTKLIKVTADDFEISDINISGLPTGRRVVLSGDYVVIDYIYYTITWKNADGTVLETDTVAHGMVPTYDGATPTKASTAQYSYAFKSWDGTPVAATANKTYTAQFSELTRTYKVTIAVNNSSYGSVSNSSLTVNYGITIRVDSVYSNKLSVGDTSITATAKSNTASYTYSFNKWTQGSTSGTKITTSGITVTSDLTIYANFTREEITTYYTVMFDATNFVGEYCVYNDSEAEEYFGVSSISVLANSSITQESESLYIGDYRIEALVYNPAYYIEWEYSSSTVDEDCFIVSVTMTLGDYDYVVTIENQYTGDTETLYVCSGTWFQIDYYGYRFVCNGTFYSAEHADSSGNLYCTYYVGSYSVEHPTDTDGLVDGNYIEIEIDCDTVLYIDVN